MRTRFVLVALGLVFFGMNAAVAQDQEGPEIRALFPDIGSTGTRVVIVGKNLAAEGEGEEVTVTFGDKAAEISRSGSRHISVKVPEGLDPGECDVTVTVGGITSEPAALISSGEDAVLTPNPWTTKPLLIDFMLLIPRSIIVITTSS